MRHSIAIVGMACRFGGAPDLQAYWTQAREGRQAFEPVPADRWDNSLFLSDNPRATDKSYCPNGAWIEDVQAFPALALGIPPRRVEVMDPQQRLSVLLALQALDDAGVPQGDTIRARAGVFMGVTATEYRGLLSARVSAILMASGALGEPVDPEAMVRTVNRVVPSRPFSAPGALGNMVASAVAQELDLKGPAYTTDAACASAMVALSDAVLQLRAGYIDLALTGGVYLCVSPDHHIVFSRIGALSHSGICRPFDARADGFVQGEGGGIVVLQRLEDALAQGRRVYAVIDGISTNNDGRGDGPMAPLEEGQRDVLLAAWKDAGLDPAKLGYVEAHGTGTSVGDPTEFAGLVSALGDRVESAALGSSKANIGHTMSGAGAAGLIRAALAIYHREIPPLAGFERVRDDVPLEDSPFYFPTSAEPWKTESRLAGVSSFGFGGTNCHAVLRDVEAASKTQVSASIAVPAPAQPELLLMSGANETALRALAGRTAEAIALDPSVSVAGVARAWAGRRVQSCRLALVASSREALIDTLRAVAKREEGGEALLAQLSEEAQATPPKLAFLYPGQGSQRLGLISGIRDRFAQVAESLQTTEEALGDSLSCPLTHLLYPERRASKITQEEATQLLIATENCQPALLAVGVALSELLAQVGVRPAVVTGHSLGEITAAVVGGVLPAASGAAFVAERGRRMAALPGDHGAMAALMCSPEQAAPLLVEGAVLANFNHPRQVVASGLTPAIAALVEKAKAARIKAIPLEVSHGFHSPALEALACDDLVDGLQLAKPTLTVASAIDDQPYADAAGAREVFRRHARSPVHFEAAIRQCVEAGASVFLQVGAGGPLAAFARGCLPKGTPIVSLAGVDDDDGGRSLLLGLGRLFTLGVPLQLEAVTGIAQLASLPPLELPTERYWGVKQEVQPSLDLGELRGRLAAGTAKVQAGVATTESGEDVPAAALEGGVSEAVLSAVAKASAYPRASIRPQMKLIDDLGFDSLMVADLAEELIRRVEGLAGIEQDFFLQRPSVGQLVSYVETHLFLEGADAADDDAPLLAYRPGWQPLPLQGAAHEVKPLAKLLLTGNDASLRSELATQLAASGLEHWSLAPAAAAANGEAELVLFCASAEAGDESGALIAVAAAQAKLGRHPDLICLCRSSNPFRASLAGAMRALAAEWPEATLKCLVLDDGLQAKEIAALLQNERLAADLSVDARYDAEGRRFAASLAALPEVASPSFESEVVLISGGNRGIGALLAGRLLEAGATVLMLGRSAAGELASALIAKYPKRAISVLGDVLDLEGLKRALASSDSPAPTMILHAAGLLADGAVEAVAPALGASVRAVKVEGLENLIQAAGPSLEKVLAIGSWAGRFGNRHQTHYAAANAQMAARAEVVSDKPADKNAEGPVCVVAEFGPWISSSMVSSLPEAVITAMRSEGVEFVGDEAGLNALLQDFGRDAGVVVHGRSLIGLRRHFSERTTLSVATHPYLGDHAIEGKPVLPLAAAADLLAFASGVTPPFELHDLRLFGGVSVEQPTAIRLEAKDGKLKLFAGAGAEADKLAYQARLTPLQAVSDPGPLVGGEAPSLPLRSFYDEVTFHGPLLQGIEAIEGVGEDFVRGRLRSSKPRDFIPGSDREDWSVDPLVLDAAMQLAGYVAWTRFGRAGTPVQMGRLVQLAPLPEGSLIGELRFEAGPDPQGDRFVGALYIRDLKGKLLLMAEEVVASLQAVPGDQLQAQEEAADADAVPNFDPVSTDPAQWEEVKDLALRLDMAEAAGITNPFFVVHEGCARDTSQVATGSLINFSSYNYLGYSGDPRVNAEVIAAVKRYGSSVSASRLASGERPFHQALEAELAAAQGTEDAVVFTAGHATNVNAIGHLFGEGDLVLHDELIHDSILQGVKLSGAARRGFAHDDPAALEAQLKALRGHYKKVLVVVEGVYSMDGDVCSLPAYVALKKRYGALLMVDEAHSFGVIGAHGLGVGEHYGLDGSEVDLWMGTLSKSLASCGGWIAGSKALIRYLRYTAPGFVYSAGLTPANGLAALTALRLMRKEPERCLQVQARARFFREQLVSRGLDTGPARGESAVVPVITGNSMHALLLSSRLFDSGINVQPILYPAVADDAARLRFFLSCLHKEEQLEKTAELVAKHLSALREEMPA